MNPSRKRIARHLPPAHRLVKPGRPAKRKQRDSSPWIWIALVSVVIALGVVFFLLFPRPKTAEETPVPPVAQLTKLIDTGQIPTPETTTPLPGLHIEAGTPTFASTPVGFDPTALQKLMLELINQDRMANGLQPVQWDSLAAAVGQSHAEEMASVGYLSHWNLDGYGPDHRYARAGGTDTVFENVYHFQSRWSDGTAASIPDWSKVIRDAEASLMDSEGHRANILAPEHTHVGIGIAYNSATGDLKIAQEFLNRYVQISPLPRRARLSDRVVLRGKFLGNSSDPVVNLAYEPVVMPLSLEQLKATGTYQSVAKTVGVIPVHLEGNAEFTAEIRLPANGRPGLYHIRLWVNHGAFKGIQVVNAIVEFN